MGKEIAKNYVQSKADQLLHPSLHWKQLTSLALCKFKRGN